MENAQRVAQAASQTDKPRSTFGMASPLVMGRVASMALTFALPLLLARSLDAAAFGTYKQLFLVAMTVLMCCQFGLGQSLYYFLPREGAGRGAYVGQVLLFLGGMSVLAAFTLFAASPAIARVLNDNGLVELALPMALLTGGMLLASPLEGSLTSEGHVGLAALCYVLSDGTRAALLLGGAHYRGLSGLAWGGAIWAVLRVGGLAVALVFRAIPVAWPRRDAIRAQLAYAVPFAGSVWLFVAQKQFIQYAIAGGFDTATFALFSVAAFHLPVVDILYTPIGEVLMVQLGRNRDASPAERLAAWDDAVEKLATLLWPATACAWLFGSTVLPMLFTQKYAASVPLFMLATIEIPLWVLPVDSLLRAAGKTRFLFGWYAARIALTAALVIGGMKIGAWVGATHMNGALAGAILGGIISEAISRVVMAAAGRSLLGAPLARALDPALWRVAVAAVAAALPGWAAQHFATGKLALVLGGGAYGVAYVALTLVLRQAKRRGAAPVMAAVAS